MTKMIEMVDVLQARDFLRAICQTPPDDPDPTFIFQTVDDRKTLDDDRPEMRNVYSGTIFERAHVLTLLNRNGGGIFAQINEGPARGKAQIKATRALWIDDDLKAAERPSLIVLPPSIIVRTRPQSSRERAHSFWLTERNEELEKWALAQAHLAQVHGTDPSMAKLDQCMRLPGFLHNKPGKAPERSLLLECHPKRVYTIDQVLEAYPAKTLVDVPIDVIDDINVKSKLENVDKDSVPAAVYTRRRLLAWLNSKGIKYVITPRNPLLIKLNVCPFNASHGDSSAFSVYKTGGIKWGCFHESCGENKNRWRACKDLLGDWEEQIDRGDHVELAQRIRDDLRDNSSEELVTDGGTYRYEEKQGIWEQITTDDIKREAMSYAGVLIGSTNRVCRLKDSDVSGIARTLATMTRRENFFQQAPIGALFKNGFLTIVDGKPTLQPLSPAHRCRVAFPFDYEETARSPLWEKYLNEVFEGDEDREDKKSLLQEFVGACLMGAATKFQRALYLVGNGANGKSVTLDVVASLFPANARSVINPQDFSKEHYKILLETSRVNLVTEVPERDIFDTAPYKAVIDGSETTARNLYEKPRKILPGAGHIFACNTLPGSADMSDGFWRRALLVPYNRRFDEDKADLDLTRKIKGECAGVATWAIVGAARALARGKYTIPESAVKAKAEWRTDADSVALFAREAVTVGGSTTAESLFQAFKSWVVENCHKQMTKVHFCRRLNQLGFVAQHSRMGNFYAVTLSHNWAHFITLDVDA